MAVVVETTLGDITIDLYTKERPKTCMNFLKLCKMKYYNFNLFHSVQHNFIAQTGDPTGTGHGGESIFGMLYGSQARYYAGEQMPKIKHSRAGLVSMVNCGENMLGAQFFITLGSELSSLDGEHCVFGEVTEGEEILLKLNEAICDETHRPYQDIRITHTIILEDPFDDPSNLKIPDRSPSPTAERLMNGRLAPDEAIDEMQGKTLEEIEEIIQEKEAAARATILEIVGDLPDANMAPPENVLFVCKLNPVTNDDDLEIIFSRFGKINSCEVIRDKVTGDSLQYAFIEFAEQKACEDAYFKMDNVLIDDRRIHVDFSQSVAKVKWRGKGRGVDVLSGKPGEKVESERHRNDKHPDRQFKPQHISSRSPVGNTKGGSRDQRRDDPRRRREERQKSRDRSRSRNHHDSSSRSKRRDRSNSRHKDRSRDRSSSRHKDRSRDRSSSRNKDRSRDRSSSRNKDRSRNDKSKVESGGRSKDKSTRHSRDDKPDKTQSTKLSKETHDSKEKPARKEQPLPTSSSTAKHNHADKKHSSEAENIKVTEVSNTHTVVNSVTLPSIKEVNGDNLKGDTPTTEQSGSDISKEKLKSSTNNQNKSKEHGKNKEVVNNSSKKRPRDIKQSSASESSSESSSEESSSSSSDEPRKKKKTKRKKVIVLKKKGKVAKHKKRKVETHSDSSSVDSSDSSSSDSDSEPRKSKHRKRKQKLEVVKILSRKSISHKKRKKKVPSSSSESSSSESDVPRKKKKSRKTSASSHRNKDTQKKKKTKRKYVTESDSSSSEEPVTKKKKVSKKSSKKKETTESESSSD